MDVLAIAGGRLLRAWEQRSYGKYALLTARKYWRIKVDELTTLVAALKEPVAPAAAPASPVDDAAAPRVADYTATPAYYTATPAVLQPPECRLTLTQRAVEGLVRVHELHAQCAAAFEYVTSAAFTREALAMRRGDQATLSTWSGFKQGGGLWGRL